MIRPLAPGLAAALEKATLARKTDADPAQKKLIEATKQMESVFVRELLNAAKVGGPKADSGYGSMAVDALADAIEAGGGFGLARRIQQAVEEMHRAPKDPVAAAVPGNEAGQTAGLPPKE